MEKSEIFLIIVFIFLAVTSVSTALILNHAKSVVVEDPNPCNSDNETANDYFYEIAFGQEYGTGADRILKFTQEVKVKVFGSPNEEDIANLRRVIDDLNDIIDEPRITITESSDANVQIYFVRTSEIGSYVPGYVPGNWGFFHYDWNSNYELYRAYIGVSTNDPLQSERNHLIREELTQSLGMAQDSCQYPDSIFFCRWYTSSYIQTFSELDVYVIEMLYSDEINSGMTKSEVEVVLNSCQ